MTRSGPMPALSSRRRFVVGAKSAFGVCEATVFPGATELLLRPGGGTWRDLTSAERWRSLAFAEPDAGAVEAAKRALARADALAAEGSLQEAQELYRAAADGVGYKGYKIWQAATLRRGQLEVELGDAAGNGTTGKVWLWGRGVRFPGWYIVSYLTLRSAYVSWLEEEGGKGKGPEVDAEGASFGEIALILALGGGWLAALRVYGLPDL